MRSSVFALAFTSALAVAGSALAWGDDGHKLVAMIAYSHLTPKAKQAVDALLRDDADTLTPKDFASRATWADHYRDAANRTLHYRQTHLWHFVDLEISAPDYTSACFGVPTVPAPASAGPEKDCAVNKVNQFEAELANPQTPEPERIMALKFIMHFVGDIHQPLHSADDHDNGGNCEQVIVKQGEAAVALHRFWDDNVIDNMVTGDLNQRPTAQQLSDIARTLSTDPRAQPKTAWTANDTLSWAQDAFRQAKDVAFNLPPHAHCTKGRTFTPILLSPGYEKAATDTARNQVTLAGGRLATILNVALR